MFETSSFVKLHLLLALMIFTGLVHSFVEAIRLHLPTGATPQHAGAWLPDEADGPAKPARTVERL